MMNLKTRLSISIVTLCLAPLALACEYPSPPAGLPDGNTATKEEMIAGVKVIKAFQQAMIDYRSCIEANEVLALQSIAEDDADGRARQKEIATQKHDASVEDESRVVEQFNIQIRAYKARAE